MAAEHETILATAKRFFELWAANDVIGLQGLLTDDATIILPLSGDGSPDPLVVFEGATEAMGYLQMAMANLPQIRFLNQEWSVSDDAQYVHLHARGDMVAKTGAAYRNVYVYRLTFRAGRITQILEYANPVAWANLDL